MQPHSHPFRLTRYLFYALFFLTPLLVTPFNYELFEFNKMLFVYGMTSLITASVAIHFLKERKLLVPTTPLDIPIFLFLLSQFISTIFSIDPHMSLWGYYGRFNGGLVSTICYILLYYSFIIAFSEKQGASLFTSLKQKLFHPTTDTDWATHFNSVLLSLIGGGLLVSIYAFLQTLGIDTHLWVQDVQNRVFSTLGQPNWLAAFSTALAFIGISLFTRIPSSPFYTKIVAAATISLAISSATFNCHLQNLCSGISSFTQFISGSVSSINAALHVWLILTAVLTIVFLAFAQKIGKYTTTFFASGLSLTFYTTLLFTKSRSGFLAFWICIGISWLLLLIKILPITNLALWMDRLKDANTKSSYFLSKYLILNILFVLFTSVIQPPFEIPQIMKESTPSIPPNTVSEPTTQSPASFDTNITDSGDIRKIVWKGAWNAALSRPYFGYGVETFAWVYYRFKPLEHNLTSEWDFLYNKAHNEFLNFAATSGFAGLLTYLSLIGLFTFWLGKTIYKEHVFSRWLLFICILCAYTSLQISHFFGFSVVVTSLLFWLLPALAFSFSTLPNRVEKTFSLSNTWRNIFLGVICLISIYSLGMVAAAWTADYFYAKGEAAIHDDHYQNAYFYLSRARTISPYEPLYKNELSETASVLAYAAAEQGEATASAEFEEEAISMSNEALHSSPSNVSFWKSRTRLFYNLSQADPAFLQPALESIETAQKLAPTDPKIAYNRAILLNALGSKKEAISVLEESIKMKSNYRDSAWALALFYEEDKNIEKRDEWLHYILEKINPDDSEVKQKLAGK